MKIGNGLEWPGLEFEKNGTPDSEGTRVRFVPFDTLTG